MLRPSITRQRRVWSSHKLKFSIGLSVAGKPFVLSLSALGVFL